MSDAEWMELLEDKQQAIELLKSELARARANPPQPPAAGALAWTRKPPTEPGWYWYRQGPTGGDVPIVTQVYPGEEGLRTGFACRLDMVHVDSQWAGPVRCPGESTEPRIVCLCGSTRFKDAFIEANFRESRAGRIVLTVGWFSHADGGPKDLTPEAKAAVDELHLRKIDLADEILVLNVGGYVGDSTRREVEYARKQGKAVRWLEGEPAS